jgi:peptidyl-prolyl cis-trans isomerase D
MLNALRNRATGWIAQLFIVLLVVSFGVWGVADIFTGFRADTLAEVGRTEISTTDFARQYDLAMRQMGQQLGRPLTKEQAQMFGVPTQVMGRLIVQATLDDTARRYRLGMSNETLAKRIAEDPAFKGPSGTFDRNYFSQILRNAGYSEDQFVQDRRGDFLRSQISDALAGGGAAPQTYLEALHVLRTEERGISYVVLTAAAAGDIADPTDAELNAYFEQNKAQWRAPEYRALSLFKISPADIAKPADVSDADARANYDANIKDYSTLEKRKVSQIHFDTRDEADAAAAEIAGGKTFDDIAAERKLSPADVSLGLVTRDTIIDPKIAEAAFSIAAGTTSGVVESEFGYVIVRVEEIQPGSVKPFDEVKDSIKQSIAVERAGKKIVQIYDQVEDARAAGETLAEIAPKVGATLVKIDAVDRTGTDTNGNKIADLPGGNDLLNAAFDTDVGIENDAVRLDGDGYVWVEVTAVTADRDRDLKEVRDKVVAAWKDAEIAKRLAAKADEIKKRVAGGETLENVASQDALEVKTAAKLLRSAQPPADLSAAALEAAFGGPKGYAAVADGAAAGTKVVLVVTDVTTPPFDPKAPDLAQMRDQLGGQITNDYLQQFLAEMQQQLGLTVNQKAMQAVVAQQSPGM